MVTEYPQLGALAEKCIAEKQTQFTLLWIVIIKELRKKQVRSYRDKPGFDCKPTVSSGGSNIVFNISGIRAANIDDWPECTESFFFFFYGAEGIKGCRVRITFCVFVFDHSGTSNL